MANINPEIISRVSAVQNQIWQTVSITVGEAAGIPITFGSPLTVSAKTSDLYADIGSAMLVVQFSFANLAENAQVVLMSADSFLSVVSALRAEPQQEVDENMLADHRPILEAIVQGICMAVGNLRNETMVASGLSIRYQIFNFPPNLQRQDELIRTQIAVSGEELSGTAVWLMDEETAKVVLGANSSRDGGESEGDNALGAPTTSLQSTASVTTHPYEDSNAIELLLDIPLDIAVELGRVRMLIKDVVELGTGSIIEIDKAAGEPVDVMVNGRLVAKGEVVVIEDNFGVRITEILTPQERLLKLSEVA